MTMTCTTLELYDSEASVVEAALKMYLSHCEMHIAAGDTESWRGRADRVREVLEMMRTNCEITSRYVRGATGSPGTIDMGPRHFGEDDGREK